MAKGIKFVLEIYKLTSKFSKEELYGISSQMRRAAVSIPSNITEGHSRKHRQEHSQFIRIVYSSGAELADAVTYSRKT